ncbi:unnamed protein product [marine sediment metagenome]|uniref:Uncharacterized protein n=1 Tax=marine sediment metagenome TaxID=412755 RepID=X0WC38_9ZZZZ
MDSAGWRRFQEASFDAVKSWRAIYLELKRVGFSRREAIELLKSFINTIEVP